MADLLHATSQNYRAMHPDTLTQLDFLALRTHLIAGLEREERLTRTYAGQIREGAAHV